MSILYRRQPPNNKVLVVRTDLNMSPGKIAAQCGYVPTSRRHSSSLTSEIPYLLGMEQTCDASLLQGADEK